MNLQSKNSPTLKLLFVGAVLIRLVLAVAWGDHAPQIHDAKDYEGLAIRLNETGSYIGADGTYISQRPPLYPAFAAVTFRFFGDRNYFAVSIVQSIISLLIILNTYQIGRHLCNEKVGLAAAGIVAFYPSLLAFNCLFLSETLFTYFFTLAVYASLRIQSAATLKWAVLLGICLGLGALTRSILYACTPPLLLYLFATGAGPIKSRFASCLVALTVCIAVIAPWAYRNTKLHRTFTVVDVMGGRNVMMGNYEHTPLERSWATVTDVTGEKAWHHTLRSSLETEQNLTQGQLDKLAMKYGIRYFFKHPALTTKRCLVRFFNFWQLERTIPAGLHQGIWGSTSKTVLISISLLVMGTYATLLLFCLHGLILRQLAWRQHLLLLLWIALPCAIHTIAFAHSRYHLPLIPILAIYSALHFATVRPGDAPSHKRPLFAIAPCLLFSLFILAWIREIIFVDLQIIT